MNFVEEVLTTVNTAVVDTVRVKLPVLQKESNQLRDSILKFIEDVYIKYAYRPKRISTLFNSAQSLINVSTELKDRVGELAKRDVTGARLEVIKYNNELDEVNQTLLLCSNICNIHDILFNNGSFLNNKEYLRAMKEINSINLSDFPDHEIKIVLRQQICSIKTDMEDALNKIITDNFKCVHKENEGVTVNEIIITDTNNEIEEALLALSLDKENIRSLDRIVKFLWEEMFMLIIYNKSPIITSNDGRKSFKLTVGERKKVDYTQVIANLIAFVPFLNSNFNYKLSNEMTTIEYIGLNMRDNLCELIIKESLYDTIPNSEDELKKYSEVIERTKFLQTRLVENGIFTEETTSIMEYVNNVEVHFITKKCKMYNEQADKLLKKDLHDVVQVGEPMNPSKFTTEDFLQCSISKNVLDILELVKEILLKAATMTEVSAGRLIVTAKNILFKYGPAIMEHHKRLLETIPQQVAIFYNNCKYICHYLDHNKWHEILNSLPKTTLQVPIKFDFIRLKLLETANQLFDSYVQKQEKQIEEIVKDTGIGGALRSCEELEATAEKGIRQSLRQLELLKTVWQKILNYSDYNKTMGFLLNSLCNSLIEAVLTIEDISSKAAEQMVDLFKLVMTRGPKLFTDPKEINIYVESWHKLSELVFVLNSNLLGINNRWADGKGPLSLHFSPFVIRGLIRALFQNSERRAAVLAQIHD